MPSSPRLRAAVVTLATVLGGAAGAVLPLAGAAAVGDGNPVIISPAGTVPVYEGFTGPYVVDLGNAPLGGYTYRVELTPPGEEPQVVAGPRAFTQTEASAETRSLTLPALPPAAAYTFVVEDGSGDRWDSSTFEVRDGAQPRCSVITPANLRVNAAEEVVYGRLASNCSGARAQYASWDVKNLSRGTYVNSLVYDGTTKDFWKYFDGQPLGTYVVKPVAATNAAADDIVQNAPRTVVRLDARFSFSTSRSGPFVTLTTSLRKYSRSANVFGPWGRHAFALSYRTCATCAWKHFHTQTTSPSGTASHRIRATSVREYRVTSSGTESIWAPYPHYEKR